MAEVYIRLVYEADGYAGNNDERIEIELRRAVMGNSPGSTAHLIAQQAVVALDRATQKSVT